MKPGFRSPHQGKKFMRICKAIKRTMNKLHLNALCLTDRKISENVKLTETHTLIDIYGKHDIHLNKK
jgi:hypothetical protein